MKQQPEPISYQVAYLWECPDCGTIWQARHRPRGGAQLVCAALTEQRAASGVQRPESRLTQGDRAGCGVVHVSSGHRGGIARNVSI